MSYRRTEIDDKVLWTQVGSDLVCRVTLLILLLVSYLPSSSQDGGKTNTGTFDTYGSVQTASYYGVLPYVLPREYPQFDQRTDISVGFGLFGLVPVKVDAKHRLLQPVWGRKDEFRVALDTDRLVDKAGDKVRGELDSLQLALRSVEGSVRDIQQQQAYWSLREGQLTDSGQDSISVAVPTIAIPDTVGFGIDASDTMVVDTLNTSVPDRPSADPMTLTASDIDVQQQRLDTRYKELQDRYNKITTRIEALQQLANVQPKNRGFRKFLRSVDRFAIGYITPSADPLVIRGVQLKGIEMELSGKMYAYGFHGRSINRGPLVSPSLDERPLDFLTDAVGIPTRSERASSDRLTYGRVGIGGRDEDHLHVAILSGKGPTSSMGEVPSWSTHAGRSNLVAAVHTRKDFGDRLSIHASASRAAVAVDDGPESTEEGSSLPDQLVTDGENAFEGSAQYRVPNTRFRLSLLWTDRDYRSFAAPFIRPGEWTKGFGVDRSFGQRIKLSGDIRVQDRDLGSITKSSRLTGKAKGRWKITRHWRFSYVWSASEITIEVPDQERFAGQVIQLHVASLMYTKRFKKTVLTSNLSASLVSRQEDKERFKNDQYVLLSSLVLPKGYFAEISAQYIYILEREDRIRRIAELSIGRSWGHGIRLVGGFGISSHLTGMSYHMSLAKRFAERWSCIATYQKQQNGTDQLMDILDMEEDIAHIGSLKIRFRW